MQFAAVLVASALTPGLVAPGLIRPGLVAPAAVQQLVLRAVALRRRLVEAHQPARRDAAAVRGHGGWERGGGSERQAAADRTAGLKAPALPSQAL